MTTKAKQPLENTPGTEAQPTGEGLNIYQRLNHVRNQVSYLQKDKQVEGYKAVTHDLVTATIRPHLINFGIMVVPKEIASSIDGTGKQTKNGTPITRFTATYEIAFVNVDDPQDKVVCTITAVAEDTADKGPGKCISYAVKYAYLKLLSIETGESEESRIADTMPTYITEAQADQVRGLLMDNDMAENKVYMAKLFQYLNIENLQELKAVDFDKAIAAITSAANKRKQQQPKPAANKGGANGQQSLL